MQNATGSKPDADGAEQDAVYIKELQQKGDRREAILESRKIISRGSPDDNCPTCVAILEQPISGQNSVSASPGGRLPPGRHPITQEEETKKKSLTWTKRVQRFPYILASLVSLHFFTADPGREDSNYSLSGTNLII